VSLVLLELAYVLFAVGPDQVALTVHFVVHPITIVDLIVRPYVPATPLNLIQMELSVVHRPIREGQLSSSVLLPFVVLSLINRTIRPRLKPLAVLLVVSPLPNILGSVGVGVCSVSICLIV
jgi:hypothetical protein